MAGAYTCSNSRVIPPERITCRSSMLSAPAAIPAMIELSFPAGFTPAEATRVSPSATRSAISCDSPACSANAITGTKPASDTRSSSSNSGVALDHGCDRFTSSAFWVSSNQGPQHSRFSCPRRHFHVSPAEAAPTNQITPRIALSGSARKFVGVQVQAVGSPR